MKRSKCFLFLVFGATADFGGSPQSPSLMPEQISMMMSDAKLKLSSAQRHQAKVIDKLRKKAEKTFGDEAATITEELTSYIADVRSAEMVLESALNTTEAGLKAEKMRQKRGGWDSKASMSRARLGAEVGGARQALAHERHEGEEVLRKAERLAEGVIGSEADRLGMKLGDLAPIAAEIDEQLEEHVKKATEALLKANTTFTSPRAIAGGSDGTTRLGQLNQGLGEAERESAADAKAAGQKLDKFLASVSSEASVMSDKVLSELAHSQKQDIDQAFSHPAPAAIAAHKAQKAKAPQARKEGAKGIATL